MQKADVSRKNAETHKGCGEITENEISTIVLDEGFRADIIVEDRVILELKSIERTALVHRKQLLTYLRLSNKRLGLLINFGEAVIFIKRGANGIQE